MCLSGSTLSNWDFCAKTQLWKLFTFARFITIVKIFTFFFLLLFTQSLQTGREIFYKVYENGRQIGDQLIIIIDNSLVRIISYLLAVSGMKCEGEVSFLLLLVDWKRLAQQGIDDCTKSEMGKLNWVAK